MKNDSEKSWRIWKFENYNYQRGFTDENSYYLLKRRKNDLILLATNLKKKIPDSNKAKEENELFLKNKGKKKSNSIKHSEKTDNSDIKSVIVKHIQNLFQNYESL